MALRGTLTHRKTRRLARILNFPLPCALGIVEALWHVCAELAPAGDIGRMGNVDIADEMFFPIERADELINALVEAEFLERNATHRLIIHDWHIHSDDATDNKLARNGQRYASGHLPRMRRLSKAERAKAWENFTATTSPTEPQQSVRTDAHNGAQRTTESHYQSPEPEPEPEPAKGDARATALPSIAPTPGADPEDEIPDGLAKVQYAAFVLEQLPVAANNALKIQTGDAIELIAKTERCKMAVATKRMLNRMRAAKRDGPVKWNFWLSEGQFTAEAHEMRNDSHPGKIDSARATSRAAQNVSAGKGAFRAAAERLRGSTFAPVQ